MTRILRLKPDVANQIAAGEVIERPASVVKELLENALDAKASQITIEINGGGLSAIIVSDNGQGINADDLPLAISAHATSKITQLEDLYSIRTKGFRGEALASIASVSKLSILSKPDYQACAARLEVLSEQVVQRACAREQGTTVEVRDLFFNAPVRKKFLKSEQRERQVIEFVVKKFSLSAPEIALTFKSDGKTHFNLPAAAQNHLKESRIRKLLGKQFFEHACYFKTQYQSMKLSGWVSGAGYQRSQNDKQWIYINGRMVKDKLMVHAIKQAYEDKLHPGRYPSCLIYLEIPGYEIDINVHPAKDEVRFQEPRCVHDFVSTSVTNALESNPPSFEKQRVNISGMGHHTTSKRKAKFCDQPQKPMNPANSPREINFNIDGLQPLQVKESKKGCQTDFNDFSSSTNAKLYDNYYRLNSFYFVIIIEQQPHLVDFKRLYKAYLQDRLCHLELPFPCRPLLVPIHHKLTLKEQCELFEKLNEALLQIGVNLELSSQFLVIKSMPLCLPHLDLHLFIEHLLEWGSQARDTLEISSMAHGQLLKILVACQQVDVTSIAPDEMEGLISFWEKQRHKENHDTVSIPLNAQNCRKLFLDV